jgi:hypothetical protein
MDREKIAQKLLPVRKSSTKGEDISLLDRIMSLTTLLLRLQVLTTLLPHYGGYIQYQLLKNYRFIISSTVEYSFNTTRMIQRLEISSSL